MKRCQMSLTTTTKEMGEAAAAAASSPCNGTVGDTHGGTDNSHKKMKVCKTTDNNNLNDGGSVPTTNTADVVVVASDDDNTSSSTTTTKTIGGKKEEEQEEEAGNNSMMMLSFIVPYLAGGDLPTIARVCKAGQKLAINAFKQRLLLQSSSCQQDKPKKQPHHHQDYIVYDPDKNQSEKKKKDEESKKQEEGEVVVPTCYYIDNLWDTNLELCVEDADPDMERFEDEDTKEITQYITIKGKKFVYPRQQILDRTEQQRSKEGRKTMNVKELSLPHVSIGVQDGIAVMIASYQKIDADALVDEMTSDDEGDEVNVTIKRDVWAITYDYKNHNADNNKPLSVQPLVSNIQGKWSNVDPEEINRGFGDAYRSANGRYIAILTEMGGFRTYSKTCRLSLYEVNNNKGLPLKEAGGGQQHLLHKIEDIQCDYTDIKHGSYVKVSFSPCERFMSLHCGMNASLNDNDNDDDDDVVVNLKNATYWSVYALPPTTTSSNNNEVAVVELEGETQQKTTTKPIFVSREITDRGHGVVGSINYTVDHELVVTIHQERIQSKEYNWNNNNNNNKGNSQGNKKNLTNYVDKYFGFLTKRNQEQQTAFARRVVFVPICQAE